MKKSYYIICIRKQLEWCINKKMLSQKKCGKNRKGKTIRLIQLLRPAEIQIKYFNINFIDETLGGFLDDIVKNPIFP